MSWDLQMSCILILVLRSLIFSLIFYFLLRCFVSSLLLIFSSPYISFISDTLSISYFIGFSSILIVSLLFISSIASQASSPSFRCWEGSASHAFEGRFQELYFRRFFDATAFSFAARCAAKRREQSRVSFDALEFSPPALPEAAAEEFGLISITPIDFPGFFVFTLCARACFLLISAPPPMPPSPVSPRFFAWCFVFFVFEAGDFFSAAFSFFVFQMPHAEISNIAEDFRRFLPSQKYFRFHWVIFSIFFRQFSLPPELPCALRWLRLSSAFRAITLYFSWFIEASWE